MANDYVTLKSLHKRLALLKGEREELRRMHSELLDAYIDLRKELVTYQRNYRRMQEVVRGSL